MSASPQEVRCDEICDGRLLPAQPVLSVLMITFDHQSFVDQAVESVVAQDCCVPFEILIGDDASNDKTPALLRDLQRRFPSKIRLVARTTNLGGTENLRDLVRRARGRFLAFCEGDDYWSRPDKLSAQLATMSDNPAAALAFSDFGRAFLADGKWQRLNSTVDRDVWTKNTVTTIELLKSMPIHVSTAFTKAELVRDYFESPYYRRGLPLGDVPLFLYLSKVGTVHFMPESYSIYRQHAASATNSSTYGRYRIVSAHADVVEMFAREVPDQAARREIRSTNQRRRASAAYAAGRLLPFIKSMAVSDPRDWVRALLLLAPPLHKLRLQRESRLRGRAMIDTSEQSVASP